VKQSRAPGFGAPGFCSSKEIKVKKTSLLAAVGGALATLMSAGVAADEAASAPAPAPAPQAAAATLAPRADVAAAAAAAVAEEVVALGAGETALSTEALGEQRAAAKIELDDITINTPENNGAVVGNTALGDTGFNKIDGDAFRDSAGFMNAIQNTGNNVLIQNATIINVSVEP
jgi:hypothetical protein